MATTPELRIQHQGPCRVATWKNILFVRWSTLSTPAAIDTSTQLGLALGAQHPRGIGVVHHVAHHENRPTSDAARQAFLRHIQSLKGATRCGAVLREGEEGFGMALTRGVLTGLMLVTGNQVPVRLFSQPRQLCDWMSAEMKRQNAFDGQATELQKALEALAP